MSDGVDDRELQMYIAELGRVGGRLHREGLAVGEKGALNIKQDWAKTWSGHPYFPALPRAVSYDRRAQGADAEWEIGPDKDRPQGALGNIIEYGTVNNGPIPGGLPALDREVPRFVQALADLGMDVLSGD
ncbi:hypothetical protein [Glycomyces artemisiae]|uniref:Uncharacterized protein n=1 Tax=Glycomyces artemisiae TaxID=1076443 RepID=A0A2T0UER9_9ACTN|nr:hypothetical protein [Glycomyces artemisiae]PRY56441.1 hypothetical protein B0I28_10990 [Glycomyces artemisiae]